MADGTKTKVEKLLEYGNSQLSTMGITESATTIRGVLDKITEIETGSSGEYNIESVINENGTQNLDITSSGTVRENKLSKVIDKSITKITAEDLEGITSIGTYAFYYCQSLTSITIPDSVTIIGDSAFNYCDGLTSVTIGNNVTSIYNSAFYRCESLTEITIPDSVTSIGAWAFEWCINLTSVTIGTGVTSIGYSAFYGCSSLTSITIPNSVTSIGELAFSSCNNLMTMTILATTPPNLANKNAISTATTTIYVPYGTKNAYISATNWSLLATENGGSVEFIELNEDGGDLDIPPIFIPPVIDEIL